MSPSPAASAKVAPVSLSSAIVLGEWHVRVHQHLSIWSNEWLQMSWASTLSSSSLYKMREEDRDS